MPELSSFVRVTYATKRRDAAAIRLLNKHLTQNPPSPDETRGRIIGAIILPAPAGPLAAEAEATILGIPSPV